MENVTLFPPRAEPEVLFDEVAEAVQASTVIQKFALIVKFKSLHLKFALVQNSNL